MILNKIRIIFIYQSVPVRELKISNLCFEIIMSLTFIYSLQFKKRKGCRKNKKMTLVTPWFPFTLHFSARIISCKRRHLSIKTKIEPITLCFEVGGNRVAPRQLVYPGSTGVEFRSQELPSRIKRT